MCDGLQALEGRYRSLIDLDCRTRFVDSIDLDRALLAARPDSSRWDYLLGDGERLVLVGIEPHPIHAGAVTQIIAKKRAAEGALREHLRPSVSVSAWLWVTSGSGSIPKGGSEERRLLGAGVRFVGRRLGRRDLG